MLAWLIARPLYAAAIALTIALAGWHFQDKISDWWDGRKIERLEAEVVALKADKAALERAVESAKASERVVTKYIDRVKVVAGRTQTIIREVPVYVPTGTADLPAGYRVLHDAAAQGVIPDPARIADAAPVPAQDAAETVVSNYGTCAETAGQVIALQDWIREQQAVAK
ncbi:MAG: hypothetical protein A3E01_07035 [Gammaproteobacteria bacterium RIFCSPHIGHO2_12_FULL_63_22]|nr:MAG: hypothetical protein A3E01_07035 [Gammaproteobacteria bacterium RIFCSPHIGHO2_12_FULL_63_22]